MDKRNFVQLCSCAVSNKHLKKLSILHAEFCQIQNFHCSKWLQKEQKQDSEGENKKNTDV